jgi:hypothetical protein
MTTSTSNPVRGIFAGLLVSACILALGIVDAQAGRGGGGGGRGGGGASSSGRMAQSSVSGGNRASANSANRSGSGNRANSGNVNSGNRTNTGNVNSGNRTNNGNINTGDVNINRGDVDIDIEGGYGCCRNGVRYPVAAAVTIGAIAGTTAAIVAGSTYYALPPSGCVTVIRNGVSYYQCGAVYYQQSMSGDQVVYVAVDL